MINKLTIAKKIVSTIVGIGTTTIVKGIIQSNVSTDNIASRATVASASLVIGFAASDATSAYTDAKIDELVDWWTANVTAPK